MKNKTPLISVIMAAYNSEKYIAEAIESVLKQTFNNFELIIINDASADKTLDIIKEYAEKDKRIKLINHKQNKGISETRNDGIKEAKGKYIAIHDSDDISKPERFKLQADYLKSHPKCGVVGSHIEIFDDTIKKIVSLRKYPEKDSDLRKMIFFSCPIAQPVSMIRAEVFKKLGLYDKRYPPTEDLDLWFRIGTLYEFASIPKVLLVYRYYPNSSSWGKIRTTERLSNLIRWRNWNNKSYHFGLKEFFYNFFHLISIYTIPSKFKVWLFAKIRDKKIVEVK